TCWRNGICDPAYWCRKKGCHLCSLRTSFPALARFSRAVVHSSRGRGGHPRLCIAFLFSRGLTLSRQLLHALAIGGVIAGTVLFMARSQNLLEQLVTRGRVISGHRKYEKDCSNCHEPFSRTSQTRLCLACHKEVAEDRRASKGFHGRQTDAAKQECAHCH